MNVTDNVITMISMTNIEDEIDIGKSLPIMRKSRNTISSSMSKSVSDDAKSPSQGTKPGCVDQFKASANESTVEMPTKIIEEIFTEQTQKNRSIKGMNHSKPGGSAARPTPSKKHKCPFCETEFTRHHNLKSHLLTHSQEKPYVCQTCTMKFRRLHDLKRHTKLHTGDRPHVCPKCRRKFARGDALARHTKGQAGCAGRKSSICSFVADDNLENANVTNVKNCAIDGVTFGKTASQHIGYGLDEEQPQFDSAGLQTKNVSISCIRETYTTSQFSSIYPQAESQSAQPLEPPFSPTENQVNSRAKVAIHTNNSTIRGYTPGLNEPYLSPLNTGGSNAFSHSLINESPKPSSPGSLHPQQYFQDTSSDQLKSPNQTSSQPRLRNQRSNKVSLSELQFISSGNTAHVPKLPGLSDLVSPDQRFTLNNEAYTPNSPGNGLHVNLVTPSSAIFPSEAQNYMIHQNLASVDIDKNTVFTAGEKSVLVYVRTLENRVKELTDRIEEMCAKEKNQQDTINRLSEEILSLKNHLNPSVKFSNPTESSNSN